MKVYGYKNRKDISLKKRKELASAHAGIAFNSKNVQSYMKQVLEKHEMTDDYIAKNLKKLLDAATTRQALKTADANLALNVLKEANKLKGNYPAEKKQIETKSANLNINYQDKSEEDLLNELEKTRQDLKVFMQTVKKDRKKKNGI